MAGDSWRETFIAVLTMLILGLGFLDLFVGVLPGVPFFLVWIIGFAVVLPIVAILLDDDEETSGAFETFEREMERTFGGGSTREDADRERDGPAEQDTRDAIETLRNRYAAGDLTDAQFEAKLDRLLETDTPENAAEWRERARDPDREKDVSR